MLKAAAEFGMQKTNAASKVRMLNGCFGIKKADAASKKEMLKSGDWASKKRMLRRESTAY